MQSLLENVSEDALQEVGDNRSIIPGNHKWKVQGKMLVCEACKYRHAVAIPKKMIYNLINEAPASEGKNYGR